MRFFDTHTHYDDGRFDGEEAGMSREELLDSLFNDNIIRMVGAAVNTTTSRAQIEFSRKYPCFYAAVGVHPENCGEYDDIDGTLDEIASLAAEHKVVAVGEIGLDYYWESNPPRDVQKIWFDRQLALAKKLSKPVIVHDREAHGDCFDAVIKHPGVIGVFHSYSGSAEMAAELVKRGWYISFSGVITYKNATRLAEVVRSIPDDRILVETDCPYLAPVPMRGKINHSGYVKLTAKKAAEIRGVGIEEFAAMTTANADRLFGIRG